MVDNDEMPHVPRGSLTRAAGQLTNGARLFLPTGVPLLHRERSVSFP